MGELEDRLKRLAEHRAAQIPAHSMPSTDELAVRRRVVRRNRLVVGIAACLAVALVIGGLLLFAGKSDGPTVEAPAGTLPSTASGGCAGKAYVTNEGDGTVSVITTATGAVSAPITIGKAPPPGGSGGVGGVAITPDGKHAYVVDGVAGAVSVITTATGAVSAPITVGKVPYSVAICPAPSAHRR
jgi:YVTN family beta-propeller protein